MRTQNQSPALVAAIIAVAGLAASSPAQDSVSLGGGLPGDGLDPYDASNQVTAFAVRAARIGGSFPGSRFGIAPISKTSALTGAAFGAAPRANGVSADQLNGVGAASATYLTWTTAGAGVNSTTNSAGSVLNAPALSDQFSVVFGETGTDGAGEDHRAMLGAIINRDPTLHRQLLVTRTVGAVNRDQSGGLSSAFITPGSVDASGNAYLLADGFDSTDADALTSDDVFRVDLASRGGTLNRIGDNPATLDATARLFGPGGSPSLLLPPSAIAESVSAAGGVYSGLSFAPDRYDGTPGSVASSVSHLTGSITATRGGATTAPFTLTALGGVSTQAAIGRSSVSTGATELLVWGVDATGASTGQASMPLPLGSSLPNAATGESFFLPVDILGGVFAQFGHYRSVNAFDGGGGQIALGVDPYTGDALAAGTVLADGAESGDPANAVVVRRFDPANPGSGSWQLVAHVDPFAGTASPIWGDVGADGAPGTFDAGEGDGIIDRDPGSASYDAPMGQLLPYFASGQGGLNLGPSLSGPAIDAGGDVYFVSSIALNQPGGSSQPGVGVLRGRYDDASSGWLLELVLAQGQRVRGQNSGVEYEIRSLLSAVDTSSGGAAAPGSVFASAAGSFPFSATDLGQTQRGDPRGLGALVVAAEIVYDTDSTGSFDDPADEAYQSLLWLGYVARDSDVTTSNTNPGEPGYGVPDEQVDGADLSYFVERWLTGQPAADLTTTNNNPGDADYARPDGQSDGADLSFFIEAWLNGN